MSLIVGSAVAGAGGASAYTIDNSLRTRASASAYLSRTFASNGNTKTFTFSFWAKRGSLGSEVAMLNTGIGSVYDTGMAFLSDNTFQIYNYVVSSGGFVYRLVTTQVFRDPSAWYHIVVAYDTTQGTAANRIKLYVNGAQVTSFSTSSYPSQNSDTYLNTTNPMNICRNYQGGSYFDGYIAEVNFIDGQALTPSSFGETNASTGVWQPKAYAGSYGTNGYYLKFSDIATTSGSNAGLGKDFSGNGNYWTTNNISVTAGVTYDAMTDSPTPASSTVGNYCVLSPIDKASSATISDGNLKFTSGGANTIGRSTFGVSSGKWYWEITATSVSASSVGVADASDSNNATYLGSSSTAYSYYSGGTKYNGGSAVSYGATWTTNDIIGVALDMDAGTITFYKNGTSQGQAYSGLTGTKIPAVSSHTGTTQQLTANFGQRAFSYSIPSGYNRLETYNLPAPTIGASSTTLANKYFDATIWTGTNTSGTLTVSSLNFQPDFIWGKTRSVGYTHGLHDSVRGINNRLCSNNTSSEDSAFAYGYPNAVSSTGFTAISGSSSNENWNQTSATYVAWSWKANGSGTSNTAGSLAATVSANTTSGFSIATFTTNSGSGNATVGHGLGATPAMIIMKSRNASYNWDIYHSGITNCQDGRLTFTTDAYSTTNKPFGSVAPTSSVFTVSQSFYGSGINTVAYCFAEVPGFSKFGSYAGNGSTDGPFIYLGFKPKYVLIKRTNSTGSWVVWDSARTPYNVTGTVLYPNYSQGEDVGSSYYLDLVSNGIKIRGTDVYDNASGSTYIYAAFAESPFNYSLAR